MRISSLYQANGHADPYADRCVEKSRSVVKTDCARHAPRSVCVTMSQVPDIPMACTFCRQ